ncbi:MAG: cupin [Verrucomicrobia bacterium]|nr:MAG: cupin [Verrucomicrobiota bacterium]
MEASCSNRGDSCCGWLANSPAAISAAMKQEHEISGDGSVKIGGTDTITTPRLTNAALDDANPDSKVPPLSDVGSLPVFKYPFSFANKRVYAGGWSREVTIRELQIAKELAGVNMRLEAGGIRELHWHKAAEWSIMLYGGVRLTAIDAEGRSFVRDVFEGDLWYFPTGIPHSIQGLEPDGGEFLLVFDDGHFSEHETVLLSDIAAHIPREVMARNCGVEPKVLRKIFGQELFIFQAPVPGPLAEDQKKAAGTFGPSPCEFSFRPGEKSIVKKTKGGEARVVDSSTFKVSTTVAAAIVTVHPGGMRELHWHQNADEWQYYMNGKARMTVVGTGERARTMDFEAGDVGYIEKTLPHYIENTGDEDLRFLELFRSSRFEDLSLSEWLSHTPRELVMAHLNIDKATYDRIPREKLVVLPR